MIHELTEKIMANIGLDINGDFKVVDQDFGDILTLEGKYLKCSYNHKEPRIGKNDILFEPTQNLRLMVFIFSYFLQKYESLTQIYIRTYSQLHNNNMTALDLRGNINITSGYYKSETLKYIDIIFRLSGYNNIDFLKKYDNQLR